MLLVVVAAVAAAGALAIPEGRPDVRPPDATTAVGGRHTSPAGG